MTNSNMKEKKTGKIKSNKGEREFMELGDFAIKVNSVEGHIGQCLLSNHPSKHDNASTWNHDALLRRMSNAFFSNTNCL